MFVIYSVVLTATDTISFFAAVIVKHVSQKGLLDNEKDCVVQAELGLLFSYYHFPNKNDNFTRLNKIFLSSHKPLLASNT